ncbi:cytochrome c3 family protein [Planctellipticum variicoloris]|uniref:cytochrome c3 family protein n=1 Tax=Planctellipticum variicoloris TaxID=3064265 RepID=UPI003013C918|nr:hypothetical protein SH412_004368 [Planctomycetaceae bacterium SH412]
MVRARSSPHVRRRLIPVSLTVLGLSLFAGVVVSTSPMQEQALGASKEKSKSKAKVKAQETETRKPRPAPSPTAAKSPYVVLGYNDLGMHCMNQDFSEICILPPFNTLHATVIDRTKGSPEIVTEHVNVEFSIPGNATSVTKTNFWVYAFGLFGVVLPPDIGLTGNGLFGRLFPTGKGDWNVTGIPITPLTDSGINNPFQLAHITVKNEQGTLVGQTDAVVPVSWEINCNLCHKEVLDDKGNVLVSVATDILRKHDATVTKYNAANGTNFPTDLELRKPVLCAGCHADPALGTTGMPGVSMFSHAMHGAHAPRMNQLPPNVTNACYACHPGVNTECQRDVHLSKGITCVNCHGDMAAVGDVNRRPWVDEPTCASCHQAMKPKFQFEEPGKLFKESRGHGGVHCAACHGPQHATGPAVTDADNVQAKLVQGHAGVINDCTVCHKEKPSDPFPHRRED